MAYSPIQLRYMARRALEAEQAGDPRWLELVLRLTVRFHVEPEDIILLIRKLAQ